MQLACDTGDTEAKVKVGGSLVMLGIDPVVVFGDEAHVHHVQVRSGEKHRELCVWHSMSHD